MMNNTLGNSIIRPITSDGNTGFDQFNQLMSYLTEDGITRGSMIHDVRGKRCYLCDKGWELTTLALRDQEKLENQEMAHASCIYGYRKLTEYYNIRNVLISAGYLFNLTEEPPKYPGSTPWQLVKILRADKDRTDTYQRIELGRRKRVWEIRFINSNVPHLFSDVDDTKGYHEADDTSSAYYYVHAWTVDQLIDYLRRFRETILNTNREL